LDLCQADCCPAAGGGRWAVPRLSPLQRPRCGSLPSGTSSACCLRLSSSAPSSDALATRAAAKRLPALLDASTRRIASDHGSSTQSAYVSAYGFETRPYMQPAPLSQREREQTELAAALITPDRNM